MKTLFMFFLFLLTSSSFAQTIRRVNNIAGVTGVNVYATAQAAHDAAAPNDILYIEPSAISYGTLTLTKPLVIYGNGYFLATNSTLKADVRASSLDNVYFDTGSGGSSISGLSTVNLQIYGVSNINIQRCAVGTITLGTNNKANTNNSSSMSNIVITQNFISSIYNNGSNSGSGLPIANVIVSNNIITSNLAVYPSFANGWTIKNNTISGGFIQISYSVFDSNLIPSSASPVVTNCSLSYNVLSGGTLVGNGNQSNYLVSPELVGTSNVSDAPYQIKAGSALLTAGNGGSQVGAFGGPTPYVISGIPSIPSIVSESNTVVGSSAIPIQVIISVKSNN